MIIASQSKQSIPQIDNFVHPWSQSAELKPVKHSLDNNFDRIKFDLKNGLFPKQNTHTSIKSTMENSGMNLLIMKSYETLGSSQKKESKVRKSIINELILFEKMHNNTRKNSLLENLAQVQSNLALEYQKKANHRSYSRIQSNKCSQQEVNPEINIKFQNPRNNKIKLGVQKNFLRKKQRIEYLIASTISKFNNKNKIQKTKNILNAKNINQIYGIPQKIKMAKSHNSKVTPLANSDSDQELSQKSFMLSEKINEIIKRKKYDIQ